MQTGYTTNKAKKELANTLSAFIPGLGVADADEIVEKIAALLDAGIGIQSHPGSPLTNM